MKTKNPLSRMLGLENSIATQLLMMVFSIYVVVAVIVTLIHLFVEYRNARHEVSQALVLVYDTMIPSIANAFWDYDEKQLATIINGMIKLPDVGGAMVFDESGALLTQAGDVPQGQNPIAHNERPQGMEWVSNPSPILFSGPIHSSVPGGDAEQIGSIILFAEQDAVSNRLLLGLVMILANAIVKSVALWTIFIWYSRRLIKRPLARLTHAVNELNLDEHNLTPIDIGLEGKNELISLRDAFCLMAERLKGSQALLVDLNHTLEQRVEERTRCAEEANRAKSVFLATMSHEIRTPMNGVLGMAELIQSTDLQPLQRLYIDVIQSSGKSLLSIINDVLDYSKIEAGKMELECVDFDLDKLCLDVASVFCITAEKKGLDLIASIAPGTPHFLKGDPTRLRQILLNLMGNAVKFTESGSVTLRVESLADELPPPYFRLKFEVRDTGIGLTKEQANNLFQAFAQADQSTTRKFGGTGLGLSISKHLVELMGGTIGVQSEPNKGSVFGFTIRCQTADTSFIEKNTRSLTALKDRKVLFVEASQVTAKIFQEQAETWGMCSQIANEGTQALALMQQAIKSGAPFDLASLDMSLPGLNGMDIALNIAKLPELGSMRRILLTGMRTTPDKAALSHAGILLALQKPVSTRILKEAFLSIFENRPLLQEDEMGVISDQEILFSGSHLLIAEDNSVNQMVVKSMLKKLGVTCTFAWNGQEAISLFETTEKPFDVILMDCEMPKMDGYDATQRIRSLENENNMLRTPIIALTAHAMKEQRDHCLASGMDDHMSKPIELTVLRNKLAKYLLKSA